MPYHKPGQTCRKRYDKKRAKFAEIPFRPAATSTSSQAVAPTINVQVNQTYNFVQPQLNFNAPFPSLSDLNEVLNLHPGTSYINAPPDYGTLQHKEAHDLEVKTAEIAGVLRRQGHKHLTDQGLPTPLRSINDVTITVQIVAIDKQEYDATATSLLSIEFNPIFPANVCHDVRWVCTQALGRSGSLEIFTWMNEMPWEELKTHLMIYLPVYDEWTPWIEPGEIAYGEWYENSVKRGLEKNIQIMVGIEDSKAEAITGGGRKMMAIESSKDEGTMSESPTQSHQEDEDMNGRIIEDEELASITEEEMNSRIAEHDEVWNRIEEAKE